MPLAGTWKVPEAARGRGRDVAHTSLPELHASSFELVDPAAAMPFASFDRQASAVAAATTAVADRLCTEQRSSVIEGVHAPPRFLSRSIADHPTRPIVVERLIIEPDRAVHRERLTHRSHAEPLRRGDRLLTESRRSLVNELSLDLAEPGAANPRRTSSVISGC